MKRRHIRPTRHRGLATADGAESRTAAFARRAAGYGNCRAGIAISPRYSQHIARKARRAKRTGL